MRGIDGKTAIVTGAATGIGRASAERFAEEGANVVVADVNVKGAETTIDRIEADGGNAVFVETDVSNPNDVKTLVEVTVEEFGPLDFAHNNAGINSKTRLTHEHSEESWDRTIDVDQRAVWLCMREELPHILENEGAIVNTASLAGLWANEMDAPYATAKHGVVGLTKTAAVEFATEGVRVNAICPGLVETPMTKRHLQQGIDITAMKRAADPEELGAMAVWLCSDDTSYITGVPLPVDGGSLNGRV